MIQSRSRRALVFTLVACFVWPAVAYCVTPAQVDNFQDGTTQNWTNGGAPAIVNVPDGGPSGTGDKFLEVTSIGPPNGAGSRLITFNTTQWAGNYNSAGVGAISMDLKFISLGDPELDIRPIRVVIFNPLTFAGYASTDNVPGGAFVLPNDGAWHHWTFTLSTDSMTAINGPPAFSTQLTNVPELRILGSAAANTSGDKVVAQLGIDNVTAISALLKGDFNRDGHFDVSDIQAAENALVDLSGYETYWGLNNSQMLTIGDFDNDLSVTNLDFQGLINGLANAPGGGMLSAVPEPAAMLQFVVGGAALIWLGFSRRRGSLDA
jgi:hypothetical protein